MKMYVKSMQWWMAVIMTFMFISTGRGQQIDIPRINSMPDFPQPYQMRNWKEVAHGYDSLVFNENITGEYLPLVFFRDQSVNYPGFPSFGLHTAVGTQYPNSGEAINVIPAVVGATLTGIDKSNQFEHNWALMVQEYFNKRPQEYIYLNHPVSSSGNDWWYETMPNVFFMQLMDLYPQIEVFKKQLPLMADQWVEALKAMGASDTPWNVPYMNYRAWSMSEMQPLNQGVKQPEAAGAIAWILYHTYVFTQDQDYLKAAEWAMEFLNNWQENPSYELQLPYGIYTAARMNAEIGTSYDIEKMLNWAFNRGDLRGWGAIIGEWGGYDVHGLIGEANDNGNDYAFMMNGYQQAAALVPLVRYDHRFANAIGKWVLNLANASRLFYPAFLPNDMQDNAAWANTYDPDSFIGYEALREVKNGKSPYMTGDAIAGGWAQTNLMLYGSSHVGYLAAITDTTNVEGILKLNLLKTDFFAQAAFPSWLFFNPHDANHQVNLYLPQGTFKIYDVISKQMMHEQQNGMVSLTVPPKSSFLAVVVPQDAVITFEGNKTLADSVVIDFNNGQPSGYLPPRLKSLAAADTIMLPEQTTTIYATATDPQESKLTYKWYLPQGIMEGSDTIAFTAPQEPSLYAIACKVTNEYGLTDSMSVQLNVTEKIPYPPVISELLAEPRKVRPQEQSKLFCDASDYYGDTLSFDWLAEAGTISGEGESVLFTAPATEGNYYVKCQVTNSDGLMTRDSILMMVRDFPLEGQGNQVAYYTLQGDVKDYSGNQLHATEGGNLSYTHDMNQIPGFAASFNGTSAYVLLPDEDVFNFSQALTISFFLKMTEDTEHEQHPISHGSWEHRYKISISNQHLRFTLNTSDGIIDLDSESIIQPMQWYHVAVVYNGQDMELWLNGKLDAFISHSGAINASPFQPVLGQNIPGNNNYNFYGAMSLLNIYDFALSPSQILQDLSLDANSIRAQNKQGILVFPNPVTQNTLKVKINGLPNDEIIYQIMDVNGLTQSSGTAQSTGDSTIRVQPGNQLTSGYYILRLISGNKVWVTSFLYLAQ